jgi:hypothetical protein
MKAELRRPRYNMKGGSVLYGQHSFAEASLSRNPWLESVKRSEMRIASVSPGWGRGLTGNSRPPPGEAPTRQPALLAKAAILRSQQALQAPCVASGGTRGRALQALKQKIGPLGLRFPPLRGGASVFHLAPRCPPSASWGLRRRLRRGWTGEGRASLSPTMMDPALVGPGCFRWPRYRASVCCSGSPKRIGISSRKQ